MNELYDEHPIHPSILFLPQSKRFLEAGAIIDLFTYLYSQSVKSPFLGIFKK